MTITTLKKAIELDKEIMQLKSALACFEHPTEHGGGSTNPTIIIGYDYWDGSKGQVSLPINVNARLIELLKPEILSSLEAALDKFSSLR